VSAVEFCPHFVYVPGLKPRVAGCIHRGVDIAAFKAELLKLGDFHFTPSSFFAPAVGQFNRPPILRGRNPSG